MRKKIIKKYVEVGFLVVLFIGFLFTGILRAEKGEGGEKSSSITIDWEEFRSILKLDIDEIKLSWEEFTKILKQTGFRVKPEYRVEGGNVVLTREQFKRLLSQMKPPRKIDLVPPRDYLIVKTDYKGVVGKESTQFTATLDLEIFKKDMKEYLKIPLFREELAIEDIRLDDKPASIITQGGWHYLNTDRTGRHAVTVKFSAKSSLDTGTPGLNFNIPQTPITEINLDIPRTGLDVSIRSAKELRTVERDRRTIVTGYLVPASQMVISWKKKVSEVARGPAKVYAELFSLLTIESDAVRVTTRVKLNVVQNKIRLISLTIPPGYQVLAVEGQGKSAWSVREEGKRELLDIPFEYPIEGDYWITVKSEKILPEETMVADFSGFRVLGTRRESGFIAGEVKGDAEADIQEFQGLNRIDFQKIPRELTDLSSKPILFAFKYIRHPYNLVINIIKYKKEEALSIIIDNARGITLFKKEGKLVHQFTFTMRNLWSQFLKLELPDDASIWSVYVDGKREKASQDSDGKILIPLARSMREGEGLRSFNVDLIYTEPVGKFNILGTKKHSFPSPDALMNRLEWNLYLPVEYNYIYFGGDLKKERIPSPFRPRMWNKMLGILLEPRMMRMAARQAPDGSSISGEGVPYEEKSKRAEYQEYRKDKAELEIEEFDETGDLTLTEDHRRDIEFGKELSATDIPVKAPISKRTAGLLSIHIDIPFSGNRYLFSKKIVERGEALNLSFTYADNRIINGLIILIGLVLLYVIFKIRRIFVPPINALGRVLTRLWLPTKRLLTPKVLPVIIFLVLIIMKVLGLHKLYPLIFIVLIFVFIASLARLLKNQLVAVLRFLWRPVVSLLIFSFLVLFLVITRLLFVFPFIFLLFFIGFMVSAVRLVVDYFKKRKRRKEERVKEVVEQKPETQEQPDPNTQ